MIENQLRYDEFKIRNKELIAPLDGIVLIDPEDGDLDVG